MTEAGSANDTTKSIRGSAGLFAGRVVSLLIGMVTQVVLVRALTRADFGAFSYALALSTSIRTVVGFGEDQAFTRFLTIYDERGDRGRLVGLYVMAIGKVAAVSGAVIAALLLAQDALVGTLVDDRSAITLLAVLVFLAPIDAVDRMLEGSFAVFSRPLAIFVRKYLIEPGLRLAAVVLLVALDEDVRFVAVAYVVAAAVGMVLYATALVGLLRRRGVLGSGRSPLVLPFREYFGFSLPLVTTELVSLSLNTVALLLLGRYGGTSDVAGFRAVFPVARLNQLVIFTFTMLFTPLATRLFARDDHDGMQGAYWQTAAWLAVFTFPMFAMTVPFADQVTVTLFGDRYADAGSYLAVLSLGYYVNAAFGFNAMTLQLWGHLRWVVGVNVVVALANAVLAFALVPRYEAAGAAVSVAAALALQNVLNQAGLRRLGIPVLHRDYAPVYAYVAAGALALAAFDAVVSPPLPLAVVAAGLVAAAVVLATGRRLALAETFPELAGLPVIGPLVRGRG